MPFFASPHTFNTVIFDIKTRGGRKLINYDALIHGDAIDILRNFEANIIDTCITSPPYWGLRNYGDSTMRIWGGQENCKHEWSDSSIKAAAGGRRADRCFSEEWQRKGTTPKKLESNICSLCGAWRGQLGLEPHPSLYIQHLVEIFHEVKRILKPTGSLWLVIGDTYYGSGGAGGDYFEGGLKEGQPKYRQNHKVKSNWLQPKQKLMIPSRVAIALQEDGWILRNEVCWHKPNNMPQSARDRLTQTWESVFFFVKSKHYFFDLDSIRIPHNPNATRWGGNVMKIPKERKQQQGLANALLSESRLWRNPAGKNPGDVFQSKKEPYLINNPHMMRKQKEKYVALNPNRPSDLSHPLGKNPGDYWEITTKPFQGAHFAVFPQRLVNRMIKVSCPEWICTKCKKPKQRIVSHKLIDRGGWGKATKQYTDNPNSIIRGGFGRAGTSINETIGWSDCNCGVDFDGGVVLDPFMGSGTTCLVARKLLRHYIGIDLNPSYVEIARKRLEKMPIRLDTIMKKR